MGSIPGHCAYERQPNDVSLLSFSVPLFLPLCLESINITLSENKNVYIFILSLLVFGRVVTSWVENKKNLLLAPSKRKARYLPFHNWSHLLLSGRLPYWYIKGEIQRTIWQSSIFLLFYVPVDKECQMLWRQGNKKNYSLVFKKPLLWFYFAKINKLVIVLCLFLGNNHVSCLQDHFKK